MDAGLQPDADEVESDAGDATQDSTEFGAEDAPQVDPLDEIRAQVGTAATKAELESLRNQIRSELGRSQKLEARLDELAGANPLADVDPRLDANENLLTSIADALIASDLTDDRMRSLLSNSRAALDSARGARAQGRMREELKREIISALPQNAQVDATAETNPWAQATQDVIAEIAETSPDFDAATIPNDVWLAGKNRGTPARAAAHVLRWVAEHAETPAATRTATRRAAAGAGSPARQGSALAAITTMNEADAAYNAERITSEQYRELRERLGVGAIPGGR
jgi:hypothetical protein